MSRRARAVPLVGVLTLAAALTGPSPAARGEEDARTASAFVQGLRERGYFELAAEYLELVRKQPDAPAELLATADYELGRMLLDEAAKTGDLVRRKDLLDQARGKLDDFTRTNPTHAKTPEALVDLARLLVERGHLAMLQADETEVKADKEAKLAEARGSFDQARTAYGAAEARLKAAFDKYPKFIPEGDARRDEKERTHTSLMQAQLQKAVVDYEQGQTYPLGAKERADLMTRGLAQFEDLYKRYRLNMAGLTARMWQGKCYEEQGEYGKAMGIYNELMEHADPRLRPLQRYVGYFQIIVMGKRKEYALAADTAARWLDANAGVPETKRSREGLGVRFELAKNILAQLPQIQPEGARAAAVKRATDVLGDLVRYSSPFKPEAVALLKKYKPSAAVKAEDVARLNYEEATSQGEQALAAHDWDKAVSLLKQAVRRAEAARDVDKTNYARYNLAFGYYMNKRFYEALVLCDQLARRYPHGGLSPKAAELGMAALAEAYSTYTQVDRAGDLSNLIDLAKYAAETYPDLEQGDTARMTLGQIYQGTGKYDEAVAAFEAVKPKSSKWLEAQTRGGAAHWERANAARRAGKAADADAETARALSTLQGALKARQTAGTPPTDPGLIANVCDIADIYLDTGKPEEALKLLDPLSKQQTTRTGTPFARLTADLLRAHIGLSQVDLAMGDMNTLEGAGAGGTLTQLYFGLGKLLEKEMESLKKKGDGAGLNRTRAAYQKFLGALVASKSGQTYESLQWAGEQMLTLGNPKDAEAVFRQTLKAYEGDAKFLAAPGSGDRLLRTRLKLAAALRGAGNFGEAESLVSLLTRENPRTIEPLMEKGLLLEDQAAARKGSWAAAFGYWQKLALRLGQARTKPQEYYEAWYHAALALRNDNKTKEARQTLASVLRLSATVGGPEMKQKYKTLLEQMK